MKMFNYNNEARYVQLGEGFLGTGALARRMTVILPVSCDEPEAAAKFLDLLYTNEDVINLVNFGVEGEHYVVAENGQLDYPEGMSRQTTKLLSQCLQLMLWHISSTKPGSVPIRSSM